MGSLAYAIAKADGQIQMEEKEVIKKLAQKEFEIEDVDTEWIDQMFRKLENDNVSLEDAYQYAIDTLRANKYEFDFDLSIKNKCINFMGRIADGFQEKTNSEQSIIDRFRNDIVGL